jgi:hypothetical protein
VGTGVGLNTGAIRAFAAFDDGSGPRLAAGGSFTSIDSVLAGRLAAWDGTAWQSLGNGVDNNVFALESYDDGGGPQLFAGGDFRFADGRFSPRVAVWNGMEWFPAGAIDDRNGRRVYALEVYNDGHGAKLIAAGRFELADGTPVQNCAAWDGDGWSPAPGADSNILCLKGFQYGGQEALGMGGLFTFAGGESFRGIARFEAAGWSGIPDAGLDGSVFDMLAVEENGASSLYIGGDFLAPGQRVSRYDGSVWHRIGDGFNLPVFDLELFDDGTGPAVYAAGEFTSSGTVSTLRVAKWDGSAWAPVGGGMDDGLVHGLHVHHANGGGWLVATGSFTMVEGAPSGGVAAWNGTQWIPFDPGLDGVALDAASVAEADGAVLLMGGDFATAGDTVSGSIAAWGPCPPEPCVADFNDDGSVNTLDVLAFLNGWNRQDPRADINDDGSINTLDVLAFLNEWNAGC